MITSDASALRVNIVCFVSVHPSLVDRGGEYLSHVPTTRLTLRRVSCPRKVVRLHKKVVHTHDKESSGPPEESSGPLKK